ncbi:MAG: polyprenyl synthetase family protein [Prevotellaceae bacterium]|jgi:geranylgeranyl diphosphate synthase type II|nr:polyprenyl synthetase family protein [Prevotellaceae bacterium]
MTKKIDNLDNYLASHSWNIAPVGLYAPIGYTLEQGGKRLRPTFLLSGCKLFGDRTEGIYDAAMAIELFHNFTLLHDDLMDNADTRRNSPTVHCKWNVNTAVLSGDAMMIKSYEFLQKIPTEFWADIFPLFTKTALQVCEGQQYDMEFEQRDDVSLTDYFEMIRLKTAVLIAASLKIGAILGGASEEDAETLYRFGTALGIAFQLQDDYLDLYGDVRTFGKQIGGDILCKKKTFLFLSALLSEERHLVDALKQYMAADDILPKEKIDHVRRIYNRLDIPHICETAVGNYSEQAVAYLNQIGVPSERKRPLLELTQSLTGRIL